jgi:TPR repeat protein
MGVSRDAAKALPHLEKAYSLDRPDAALYLGRIYAEGWGGVERDVHRAEKYLEVAASANYFLAYIALARITLLRGRLIKAILLTATGVRLGLRIAKTAPDDPRLLGIKTSEPKRH